MIADLRTAAFILLGIAAAGAFGWVLIAYADRRCRRWVTEAYDEPLPPLWVNNGQGPRVCPPRPRRGDWRETCQR